MPRLSFLIPAERETAGLPVLLDALLADSSLDLEVILGGPGVSISPPDDPRLKLVEMPTSSTLRQELWSALIEKASGEWVSLVNPDDMIEPELEIMVAFLNSANPKADALAWQTLQIDADEPLEQRSSVSVPSRYSIVNMDKAAMLKAFFMWENSTNVPRVPFGLYHGAIKRSLALSIVESLRASGRKSPLPTYEWMARTLLMANELAFCERPMSVIAKSSFAPDPAGVPTPGFPFSAAIGQTAGVAEVQYTVFAEMGAGWGSGAEEAFIRAATIDCMLEPDEKIFAAKCQAYFTAFKHWNNGQFANRFQPSFAGPQPPEIRRGLYGDMLLVDRFIGKARNAQDFYRVMRSFLVPVQLICGGGAVV